MEWRPHRKEHTQSGTQTTTTQTQCADALGYIYYYGNSRKGVWVDRERTPRQGRCRVVPKGPIPAAPGPTYRSRPVKSGRRQGGRSCCCLWGRPSRCRSCVCPRRWRRRGAHSVQGSGNGWSRREPPDRRRLQAQKRWQLGYSYNWIPMHLYLYFMFIAVSNHCGICQMFFHWCSFVYPHWGFWNKLLDFDLTCQPHRVISGRPQCDTWKVIFMW